MVDQALPQAPHTRIALPAPGTVFARHVVEAMVGRGGMGVVYRARHCELDRVVALKLIIPELLEDAAIQRRFLHEAATAAAIEHPNVVPVHDAGEADGIAYMVMRYVPGQDLHALVREQGPLAPARAAEVVARVGDALDALHGAGYVHRDIKPHNVLISRTGHVYLCDFGLSQAIAGGTGLTGTGHWVGTVDYVAPEQIRGDDADARSDLYGLGGLLYFALTGRAPYERDNLAHKLWAHMHAEPPQPTAVRPELPRSLDAVVARAMAKDPSDRYASAGQLARSAQIAARFAPRSPAIRRPRRASGADPEAPTFTIAA